MTSEEYNKVLNFISEHKLTYEQVAKALMAAAAQIKEEKRLTDVAEEGQLSFGIEGQANQK